MQFEPVIVVGAGVAGLACARELNRNGCPSFVLEKSRGVGGRCATRRIDHQPVDHGVAFLHGSEPKFLDALFAVESNERLDGWPRRVEGRGRPCQPEAFGRHQTRVAFTEGVTAFPKFLAQGLDVRLGAEVYRLESDDRTWVVRMRPDGNGSATHRSNVVVLAMPASQARRMIEPLRERPELRSALRVLEGVLEEPCLTVIAGYSLDAPVPRWDVLYPESGERLLLASHDSAKRREKRAHVLVLQCTSLFSRRHLEQSPDDWVPLVLKEASRFMGDWVREPLFYQSHRWRFARLSRGTSLTSPLLFELPGELRIGFTGEAFGGGGVEAAYLSGLRLASRLQGKVQHE